MQAVGASHECRSVVPFLLAVCLPGVQGLVEMHAQPAVGPAAYALPPVQHCPQCVPSCRPPSVELNPAGALAGRALIGPLSACLCCQQKGYLMQERTVRAADVGVTREA